ncbi:uncharacterized protein LOC121595424 isoform X3 [Anopheles merus]|uniref:uncharacterized protein LOC121595424 isoform X3 n=1 Tax=Anopheles merus TaxID=30066 RepID=UPI001BE47D20|nr:uncharacterized protein LOC121595424 isoform X3 [Anopheles merus]XP_041775334.1 uncharacterized protein LOC121595424 isoform X3 [Anopheles merus]
MGEITRHLAITVARCQKVWHQLRYKYRAIRIRELAAVNKTGYPPSPPKWHCYRPMSFLQETVDESLRANDRTLRRKCDGASNCLFCAVARSRGKGIRKNKTVYTQNKLMIFLFCKLSSKNEKRKLIQLVSGHPMLWQTNNNYYNDRKQSAGAWGEITRHLAITVARCQKVWHQLRYKYRAIRIRELAAVNKTGYPPSPPKWHCYRPMSFLQETVDESLRANDRTLRRKCDGASNCLFCAVARSRGKGIRKNKTVYTQNKLMIFLFCKLSSKNEKRKLIQLVSGHSMLWQTNNNYYNNRKQTAGAWGEITRHLAITVARCQKVWHQLRYKYRAIRIRELAAVNKTGYPPSPPKWHCYRPMSFLQETVDESLRANDRTLRRKCDGASNCLFCAVARSRGKGIRKNKTVYTQNKLMIFLFCKLSSKNEKRKLIQLVSGHSMLWQTNNNYYNNRKQTAGAWGEITRHLATTVARCQKVWHQLRYKYRAIRVRELAAIKETGCKYPYAS